MTTVVGDGSVMSVVDASPLSSGYYYRAIVQ
jgi:hypothetical protein